MFQYPPSSRFATETMKSVGVAADLPNVLAVAWPVEAVAFQPLFSAGYCLLLFPCLGPFVVVARFCCASWWFFICPARSVSQVRLEICSCDMNVGYSVALRTFDSYALGSCHKTHSEGIDMAVLLFFFHRRWTALMLTAFKMKTLAFVLGEFTHQSWKEPRRVPANRD